MLKQQLTAEAEQHYNQMRKRSAIYETEAERAIYVDIPQRAMEFDQLIKTHPLLQPSLTQDIQDRHKLLLYFTPDALPDIDKIIEALKVPPHGFEQLEQFIREKVTPVLEIQETIMKWAYITGTQGDSEESMDKIQEAMTQIDENCNAVLDSLLQFHQTRGKLIGKLIKRKLYDVAKTLAQFDIAQSNDMRNAFIDLYNGIITAYDVCVKHFEVVKNGKLQQTVGGYQGMF